MLNVNAEHPYRISGDIDFLEFVAVMSRRVQAEYTPEQLKTAFKILETDETGYVRTDVLKRALVTYGDSGMSPEEAAELISAIDPENSGKINYIEYINMVRAFSQCILFFTTFIDLIE